MSGVHRFAVSLITQGTYRFYTLTMPSRVLARTCFATTPAEDPKSGFQRVLDKKRAEDIADYIDSGTAPIPGSIVLSAQPAANLKVIGKGKTLQFDDDPHAFLILDGQHRVYGFSLARQDLRVPVVVFNGLTVQEESRLFIDINTKQKPVPTPLLLAIKNLAAYESDTEALLRAVFDRFNTSSDSPLLGLMTATEQVRNKISRATFYSALKTMLFIFEEPDPQRIYDILSAYLTAVMQSLLGGDAAQVITKPVIFRAFILLFKEIAPTVKDRFGTTYTVSQFQDVLSPLIGRKLLTRLRSPGTSYQKLCSDMTKMLEKTKSI